MPKLKFGQRVAMIFKKKQNSENNSADTKDIFHQYENQTDINLQLAIQQNSTRSSTDEMYMEENVSNFEDEMALAKALSLSEACDERINHREHPFEENIYENDKEACKPHI